MKDQPTCVVDKFGNKIWKFVDDQLHDQLHREDGPAVEFANGDKWWYLHNGLHREDGPAIEFTNGTKYWYLYNRLHREDGPAVEYAGGRKLWYYHGQQIRCQTNEAFLRLLKLKAFW
jgi:hypothetical protein